MIQSIYIYIYICIYIGPNGDSIYGSRHMAAKWAAQEGTQFTCFTRQFTCFTRTKVQILTQKALRKTCITCFTSTKVQILTPKALRKTRITCFTSTKVQILTQKALRKTRIYKEQNHRDAE